MASNNCLTEDVVQFILMKNSIQNIIFEFFNYDLNKKSNPRKSQYAWVETTCVGIQTLYSASTFTLLMLKMTKICV